MDRAECERRYRELRGLGHDIQTALSLLRREGATIIESIAAVREVEGISLGEAKGVVADSQTWADHRRAHDRLVDAALKILDGDIEGKLGAE